MTPTAAMGDSPGGPAANQWSRRGAAVALGAATGVLAATTAVAAKGVGELERRAVEAAAALPAAVGWVLWPPMQAGGAWAPIVVAASATLAWRNWRPSVGALVAGWGAWWAAKAAKAAVERGRPADELAGFIAHPSAPADGLGFPSGHAAVAAALVAVLWPYLGRRGRIAVVAVAVIVAAARVVVGAHFPLDVVAGAALGVAAGCVWWLVVGGSEPSPHGRRRVVYPVLNRRVPAAPRDTCGAMAADAPEAPPARPAPDRAPDRATDRATDRSADRPAAIRARGATATIGGRIVWHDVTFDIAAGEFVAVLGPNGAGKSTLVRAILGLQPLATGELKVLGAPAGQERRRIGYLPQRRNFDAGLRVRGVDIVRLGLDGDRWGLPLPRFGRRRTGAGEAGADDRRVAEVIELVGATAYAERPVGEASGGEQQRLLIAQALVRHPDLLLLDEPLDSLDLPNQASVAALVGDVCRREGVTVLLVAHDVNPILHHLDRVVYLAHGGAVSGPPSEVISSPTLSELYGAPIEVLRTSDGRLVVVGQPEAPAHHHDRHT